MRRKLNRQFAICNFQFAIFNVVLWLIGAFTATIYSQAPTPPATQDVNVLRAGTDLTNLLFTVTDKNNRYITTLQQNDIRVLEDGVQQTLFAFQRETDRPLSIAFLIDVSISQERALPLERVETRTFIENVMRPEKDQAAIITFEGHAHLEQPLTEEMISVFRALESIEVAIPYYTGKAPPLEGIPNPKKAVPPREGSTAIWDAVTLTCRNVLGSFSAPRRTIILMTDGQDTSSRLSRNAAIDQAIKSDTIIYAIGIGDNRYDGTDKDALNNITERTGGRAFFAKKQTDLKDAFAEIKTDLRSQYSMAYRSPNQKHDSSPRKIMIQITNQDWEKQRLKLRYPQRYFPK